MASLLRKRSGHGLRHEKTDFSIPHSSTFPRVNGGHKASEFGQFPPKNRTRQRNRESLDLDEIMAGSENEEDSLPPPKHAAKPTRSPAKSPAKTTKISQTAKELMEFLDAGPPDELELAPPSKASRDLVDFLNSPPPPMDRSFTESPLSSSWSGKKGSGRLQRMISRLSMAPSDRNRTNSVSKHDEAKFRGVVATAGAGDNGGGSTINGSIRRIISKPSLVHLVPSTIIPKQPVPPRPAITSTPPDTPLRGSPTGSVNTGRSSMSRSRKPSRISPWEEPPMHTPPPNRRPSEPLIPSTPVDPPVAIITNTNGTVKKPVHARRASYVARVPVPYSKSELEDLGSSPPGSINSPMDGRTTPRSEVSKTIDAFPIPPRTIEVVPVNMMKSGEEPCISSETAYTIRKLLRNASNADECRVIFDLFMARSGISRDEPQGVLSVPPRSAKREAAAASLNEKAGLLERSIVESLLGDEEGHLQPSRTELVTSQWC